MAGGIAQGEEGETLLRIPLCPVTQDKYMSSENKDISTLKLSQLLCDLAPHTLHLDSYLIEMEWIIPQWNDLEILISCALLA